MPAPPDATPGTGAPGSEATGVGDSEKLGAVLRVCQQLGSERDLEALLALIAGEAAHLLGAERASIFLWDREKNELWSQVALGSDPIRFDARYGIAGAVVATGETINVSDPNADPRFYGEVDAHQGFETRSLLAVPLRDHTGETTGAFEVLNARSGVFDDDDEGVLKALAAQAAVAIETAQLVGELRRHRDRLLAENNQLRAEVERQFSPSRILGASAPISEIRRLIERIRDSDVDCLITGESGTGKEMVAKAIHYASHRAQGPFVALNCAALPETLVESELFGIEKGVATGVDRKTGKFEEAHGGTLFLDEIGDLSRTAQAKILRVLQERVVERVGGRKGLPIDVRVVAATNRDLEDAMREGTFREDLYYRLRVVHFETPPLREIPGDVPILANHFVETFARDMNRPGKRLNAGALRCLQAYPWPGNIRELENEMKRVVVVSEEEAIGEDDLTPAIRAAASGGARSQGAVGSLRERVETLEKHLIREALERNRGNQQQTARTLGLSRQGLIKKMKRYGLHPSDRAAGRSGARA